MNTNPTFARIAFAGLALGLLASGANATDGYFQDGYGARQKALGGAGVADSRDATAIANNPAGLVNVDDQTAVSLSLFSPQREYEAGPPTGAITELPVFPGDHGSGMNLFGFPNVAWTHRLSPNSVLGIGMYGNGGMNTHYEAPVFMFPNTGVDLKQAFLSASLSYRMGQVSFGVAPVLAMQMFKSYGLGAFAGMSAAPDALTNRRYDYSYGGGIRAGVQYDFSPTMRIGVAGSSRTYMTEFDNYKGLFAEHGSFDIPANITAGLAWDVTPSLTVMFDYKRIFYSDVAAIANPSTNLFLPAPLGADNGPGFGWHDINVFKFGVEWQYNPRWTLRAGYSYNDNPVSRRDAMFNILAPGVVQHHITGGLKYKWSEKLDIELSAMYAPENTVSGVNLTSSQPIEIRMHQYEGTVGIVYHWDGRRELEPYK
jgi:long-chain fatty acid transport protein